MRSSGVLAVLLAAVASGCAGTQWFSRAADDADERALATSSDSDPTQARQLSNQKLLDPQGADAGGRWNIAQDAGDAAGPPSIVPARPANMDLPVSEHLARAEKARLEQRLPEARPHLEAIVQQQPAHPRAHHLLAVIADLEGRWGDAEHHYQIAMQSDRNNAAIIGDLGYSYMLQGRLPLAEQYLVQAHALDPLHENAASNLARLYGRRGDLVAAQRTLADALPPAEAARALSQMFPGVPINAFGAEAPQTAMSPVQAPQQEMFAASAYPMAVQAPPPGVQQPPEGYAMGGFAPDASTAADGSPYQQFQNAATGPSGVAPASAAAAQLNQSPVVTAHAERTWPPAVWPPVTATAGATAPPAATAGPPGSSKSGVVYLMQRQPAPTAGSAAGVTANSPPTNPIAVPNGFPPSANPPGQGQPSASIDPEAQYSTGPGSSRIVTWSNLNGQSVAMPPLPPTGEQYPAGTTSGMQANLAQQSPIAQRSSPGSASGWNGGLYPPAQRDLPSNRPTLYDYPLQGTPLHTGAPTLPMAAAPQGAMPAIPSAPPHPGFEIAPAPAPPENPLSGYEAERRHYDQQLQQQVNQTYARSPAGQTPSPSSLMTVPTYQVPTYPPPSYQSPTGQGAPLTPNGTPWPGGRETAATNAGTRLSASAPPPYRAGNAPATAPSYYRAPTQPWDAAYPGPTISPAP
ncbi:MAG: hypothetical protein JNG89_08960 [Planctomycetaceae bacterium]|nr:hypothetical protein [Planctomycetaceae bacterium]